MTRAAFVAQMLERYGEEAVCGGQKARIIQYANSYVSNHRSVQVQRNGQWVDYNYPVAVPTKRLGQEIVIKQ